MSDDSEPFVDPADRSRYELMRTKHITLPVSIPRKIRWCSYLSALAALVWPLMATLPAPVRESQFAGDPASTPLGAAAVVIFGVGCLAVAGVGLAALAGYVSRNPDPAESNVWTLIGGEDALSGIAFITGFLGVVVGVGILASGHAGLDRVDWLIASGVDPYLVFDSVPATPTITSGVAAVVAVATFGLSVRADR